MVWHWNAGDIKMEFQGYGVPSIVDGYTLKAVFYRYRGCSSSHPAYMSGRTIRGVLFSYFLSG
jgi:hypothetical protein